MLRASDWENRRDLLDSGTKGWHYQEQLPLLLQEHMPELQDFEFGYCDDENTARWASIGWKHLMKEDFDPEMFNKVVGSRFEIVNTADTRLKIMGNFIMLRPLWFADETQDRRNEAAINMEKAQIEGGAYLPPGLTPDDVESTLQSDSFSTPAKAKPKSKPKGKAGRPKGSKNKKKG